MGTHVCEVSVTRPANTTAYTAGDVVGDANGTALRFGTDLSGNILSALLIDSAAEATKPELDLFLFTEAPTIAADNAAFAPTDAQMKKCVGVISFLAADFKTGATGNGVIQKTGLNLAYKAPDRLLYGVLVARNAYVPVSAEVFDIRLSVLLN